LAISNSITGHSRSIPEAAESIFRLYQSVLNRSGSIFCVWKWIFAAPGSIFMVSEWIFFRSVLLLSRSKSIFVVSEWIFSRLKPISSARGAAGPSFILDAPGLDFERWLLLHTHQPRRLRFKVGVNNRRGARV
jgi:hypothetical protein